MRAIRTLSKRGIGIMGNGTDQVFNNKQTQESQDTSAPSFVRNDYSTEEWKSYRTADLSQSNQAVSKLFEENGDNPFTLFDSEKAESDLSGEGKTTTARSVKHDGSGTFGENEVGAVPGDKSTRDRTATAGDRTKTSDGRPKTGDGRDGRPKTTTDGRDTRLKTTDGKDTRTPEVIAKERLKSTALTHISNPAERKEYLSNIEKFAEAGKKFGHSSKEMTDFYKESTRLLSTPSSRLNQTGKVRLAQDAIKQAIDPTKIDQGYHNTCNVSTVEVSMYSRSPSKAMKAITDVALTGQFKTADGSTIKIPAKILEQPSKGGDGTRSFASQVFQGLAVNTHWQRSDRAPDGTYPKMGDLRYSSGHKKEFKGDTGQRIHTESDGRTLMDAKGEKKLSSPKLTLSSLSGIYKQIAGSVPEVLAMQRSELSHVSNGVRSVSTQSELHDQLSKLSRTKNGFPMVMMVHTGNEPWHTDSGAGKAGGSGGWHVVTATGYDAATKRVSIDNTWGKSVDHSGKKGEAKTVPLSTLYRSMAEPPPKPAPPLPRPR